MESIPFPLDAEHNLEKLDIDEQVKALVDDHYETMFDDEESLNDTLSLPDPVKDLAFDESWLQPVAADPRTTSRASSPSTTTPSTKASSTPSMVDQATQTEFTRRLWMEADAEKRQASRAAQQPAPCQATPLCRTYRSRGSRSRSPYTLMHGDTVVIDD